MIATPIFATKALVEHLSCKRAYSQTLENGKRELFGRVAGQDYTKWTGQEDALAILTTSKYLSIEGYHPHGKKIAIEYDEFEEELTPQQKNNPFSTEADKKWLQAELLYRNEEAKRNKTIMLTKVCALAIIPIVGFAAALYTLGKTSKTSATDAFAKKHTHWNYKTAISHHIKNIDEQLKNS